MLTVPHGCGAAYIFYICRHIHLHICPHMYVYTCNMCIYLYTYMQSYIYVCVDIAMEQ